MTCNVGKIDQFIRILLGAALIIMGLTLFAENTSYLYGSIIVGAILALTGLFRFCLLYRLLGITTCPSTKENPSSNE